MLLLRPFQSDALFSARTKQVNGGFPETVWWNVVVGNSTTLEECIAKTLRPIGPLVALGRPGEAFPPPGGARFHETDQTWKHRVLDLLRRARIVILIPGTSQALNWEIMTAFRELKPQQLVILGVGKDTPRQYDVLMLMFKEATGRWLPHPGHLGVARKTGITFDESWVPRILRLGAPRWRSAGARLHYGLEPVFRANGIKWHPLPLSMGEFVVPLLSLASLYAVPLFGETVRHGLIAGLILCAVFSLSYGGLLVAWWRRRQKSTWLPAQPAPVVCGSQRLPSHRDF